MTNTTKRGQVLGEIKWWLLGISLVYASIFFLIFTGLMYGEIKKEEKYTGVTLEGQYQWEGRIYSLEYIRHNHYKVPSVRFYRLCVADRFTVDHPTCVRF